MPPEESLPHLSMSPIPLSIEIHFVHKLSKFRFLTFYSKIPIHEDPLVIVLSSYDIPTGSKLSLINVLVCSSLINVYSETNAAIDIKNENSALHAIK